RDTTGISNNNILTNMKQEGKADWEQIFVGLMQTILFKKRRLSELESSVKWHNYASVVSEWSIHITQSILTQEFADDFDDTYVIRGNGGYRELYVRWKQSCDYLECTIVSLPQNSTLEIGIGQQYQVIFLRSNKISEMK